MRCNEFIDIFFTNLNQVLDGDGDTRYQTGTIGICWGVGVGVGDWRGNTRPHPALLPCQKTTIYDRRCSSWRCRLTFHTISKPS